MFISRDFCHLPSTLPCARKISVRSDCVWLEESAIFKTWVRFKIPAAFYSSFSFFSLQISACPHWSFPIWQRCVCYCCHKAFSPPGFSLFRFLLWIRDLQGIAVCWIFASRPRMLRIRRLQGAERDLGPVQNTPEKIALSQRKIFPNMIISTLAILFKYIIATDRQTHTFDISM